MGTSYTKNDSINKLKYSLGALSARSNIAFSLFTINNKTIRHGVLSDTFELLVDTRGKYACY